MSSREKLSDRQADILHYIEDYTANHGRPPTIREIGSAVDISSTSVVNYNLNKLVARGYVSRDKDVSRGVRLTDKAYSVVKAVMPAFTNTVRIPLVGAIVAGEPIEVGHDSFAVYDEEDVVIIGASLIRGNANELFALRVTGDSMIDAMVNDGDIVVMRQQETARNGEMVAVWLKDRGATTLKYIYHEEDNIRLQPANPTMKPIYVHPEQVQVQGKVMMVLRQT